MNSSDFSLTQEMLKQILSYDPETGIFRWVKEVPRRRIRAGDIASNICPLGYMRVGIFGKYYKQHRLAWLYMYGKFPDEFIDHINGVRTDNRIANLRQANNQQNQENIKGANSDSPHGFLGVAFIGKTKRWRARISKESKRIYLGTFATPEEASEAYMQAKRSIHSFSTI